MRTKVVLVDDHRLVRQGLRELLEKQSGVKVVAEARDGRTAVGLARKLSPEMVIMDVGMPDLNGVEATRQIAAKAPGVKVIALSMHSDRRLVAEMLRAGASAYLLKDCAFEELADAIKAVRANETYLSPGISGVLVKDYVGRLSSSETSVFSVLSPREREVLQLLAEGGTTKQIALNLHVSVKTVETHRSRIMEKLGLYSVAELTKYALREGLVALEC